MEPIIDNFKVYSKGTEGRKQVAKNFVVNEFASKDGADIVIINDLLPVVCQHVRNWFGYSFSPTSAYRTVTHNKNVGGAAKSNHIYGMAVDIPTCGKIKPIELYNFLDKLFSDSCEIGLYSWGVHFAPTKEKSRFTDKSYKEG